MPPDREGTLAGREPIETGWNRNYELNQWEEVILPCLVTAIRPRHSIVPRPPRGLFAEASVSLLVRATRMGASCSKAVPAAIADAPPNLAEVALAVANAGSVIQLVSQPLLRRCAGAMWEPLSPLNYREDERVMKIAMEKTRKHFRWRQEYATLRGFYSLFKEDCDVLHFTGHGAQGCIFLEDRLGRAMPVDKEMLAELLDVAKRPALVFVSACQSESVAEVFIGAGISHVIAIASEENVLESDATIFAELFYELLFSGQTVQWSFDAAYNRVRFNKEDTAHKFKLLPENADHVVSIFRHL